MPALIRNPSQMQAFGENVFFKDCFTDGRYSNRLSGTRALYCGGSLEFSRGNVIVEYNFVSICLLLCVLLYGVQSSRNVGATSKKLVYIYIIYI